KTLSGAQARCRPSGAAAQFRTPASLSVATQPFAAFVVCDCATKPAPAKTSAFEVHCPCDPSLQVKAPLSTVNCAPLVFGSRVPASVQDEGLLFGIAAVIDTEAPVRFIAYCTPLAAKGPFEAPQLELLPARAPV